MNQDNTQSNKLAEAKKLLKNYKENLASFAVNNAFTGDGKPIALSDNMFASDFEDLINEIGRLLKAASLISYEKGREDERRENIETAFEVANATKEIEIEKAAKEQRKKIREFLASASVWDSVYIYERKVRMLEQFDLKFHPTPDAK